MIYKIEKLVIKQCNSIGEMIDYIIELNTLYDKLYSYLESNIESLKISYKYFNKDEYDICYYKTEEIKRDLQIIRRKTDLLENKIIDSTLPDSAMCFLFDKKLKEINTSMIKFEIKLSKIMEKMSLKFFLIEK